MIYIIATWKVKNHITVDTLKQIFKCILKFNNQILKYLNYSF